MTDGQPEPNPVVSFALTLLLAISCGFIVANVYYSQSIAGLVGSAFGLPPETTGLVVTVTQLGFGASLILLVPLGDLVENRLLVVTLISVAAVASIGLALSWDAYSGLSAAFLIGVGSVAVQVLLPYAAHLAPERYRGRMVGNVMIGTMLGIMLARPFASAVANYSNWHFVFGIAAAANLMLALALNFVLPKRLPAAKVSYLSLLASMGRLAISNALLRRRAFYQACLFGAFSLFWTTVPLVLAGPQFGMTQGEIALFALAGGAGAVAAPIAGRLADKGWTQIATGAAILLVLIAFEISRFAELRSTGLIVAAILLDFGMTSNLTLGQRSLFALGDEYRSRLNAIYISSFFLGGALGSALGGLAFSRGGWLLASRLGSAAASIAFVFFLTELVNFRSRKSEA